MKAFHIFASAAVAFAVASCSSKPEISYLPAKADSGDNWGLVDANGEFLFEDEFSNRPSAVINGIFYVEEGSGYTVYKAEKSPKQVGDLSDLKDVGYYTEGVMPVVHKGEHITFVDDEGQVKFTLDKVDGINVKKCVSMFINGRCSFMTDEGKCGAIDTKGNVVISPKYASELYFVEDYVLAKYADDLDKLVIVDKDGKEITSLSGIEGKIEAPEPFIDGYTVVYAYDADNQEYYSAARKTYTVTKDGEVNKLPSSVKWVREWNDKYIIYEGEDGKYGIITKDGEVTVRAKYDRMTMLANGRIIGIRNDKTVYIDPQSGDTEPLGKNIYPAMRNPYVFSKIFDFSFELAKEEDDEYELISYSGKEVGDDIAKLRCNVEISDVYSDFYDYEAVANSVAEAFDAQGLKGFPFGSKMIDYADSSHSVSWYRGDRSLSVTYDYTSPYFTISSATLRSDEYIVHDVSTDYYSYDWQFNPASRVDYFTVTLQFGYDKYRDELPEYIAKAIKAKFGVDAYVEGSGAAAEASEYSYYPCKISAGYNTITISCGRYSWTHEAPAVEEAVEAAADTVVAAEEAPAA